VRYVTPARFYARFPSPLAAANPNPKLDQMLIGLLDNTYDIESEDAYQELFAAARRTVFLRHGELALDKIKDFELISAYGIVDFLESGVLDVLEPVKDAQLRQWCAERVTELRPRLVTEQRIIIAAFLGRSPLPCDRALATDFLVPNQLLFLIPHDGFADFASGIDAAALGRMPTDLIRFCFDRLLSLSPALRQFQLGLPLQRSLPQNGHAVSATGLLASDQEPRILREIVLWELAVFGAPSAADVPRCECIDACLWGASYAGVVEVMRGIVRMEVLGVAWLAAVFDGLVRIVTAFLVDARSMFAVQKAPHEAIASVFAVLHGMKQMFGSPAGGFRDYLERLARGCTDRRAVVVFAVLNDTLEVPRPGVEISFLSPAGIDVHGTIETIGKDSMLCSVNQVTYDLAALEDAWCTPPVKVDLAGVADLRAYTDLLERTAFDAPHLQVFRAASLLHFVQFGQPCGLLSKGFRDHLLHDRQAKYFAPEEHCHRFWYYLALAPRPVGAFCLASRTQCCRLTRGKQTMLLAAAVGETFVSSPIHPRCALSLALTVFPGDVEDASAAITVDLFATAPSALFFKAGPFTIAPHEDSEAVARIAVLPECSCVVIDGERIAISPAIEILFVVLSLKPGTLVECAVDYADAPTRCEAFSPVCSLQDGSDRLMQLCSKPPIVPRLDSAVFNRFALAEAARLLSASLYFAVKHELRSRVHREMSARAAFRILASVNPFPEDETVALARLRPHRLFHGHESRLLCFLAKRAASIGIHALEQELERLAGRYRTSLLRRWNGSCLAICARDACPIANCFVIQRSGCTLRGFIREPFRVASDALLVPVRRLQGTALELLIVFRHFLVLMLAHNSYNFSIVHRLANAICEAHPFLQEPFARVLELARALAPTEFNWASVFLPESIVFRDLGTYLLHRYVEVVLEPHASRTPLPTAFALSASSVFVHVRAPDGHRLEICAHGETRPLDRAFVLLHTGEFTLRCADHDPCDAVECAVVPNPDLEPLARLCHWRPHHSHQLLLSAPDGVLSRKRYWELPLAAVFPWETARFALAALRAAGDSALFRVCAHWDFKGVPIGRPFEFGRRGSSDGRSSEAAHGRAHLAHCTEIADFTRASPARVSYLRLHGLGALAPLDPDIVRIAPDAALYATIIPNIRAALRHAIVPAVSGTKIEGWLVNCLKRMPEFAVLMFIEFVGGKWTVKFAKDVDRIGVFFSAAPEAVEAVQAERALVLGAFASEEALRARLMQRLQEYNDSRFESCYM
jgi:hypothetical protein